MRMPCRLTHFVSGSYKLTGPIWWWGRIAFSPDGKTIVCGSNIWELSDGKPKFRGVMTGDKKIAEGSLIIPEGYKLTDEERRSLQGEQIEGCLFLPGSRYALALTTVNQSKSYCSYIRVRDMTQWNPRIVQTIWGSHSHRLYQSMALSPNRKNLAVGEGNLLNIWDIKDEKIQVVLPSHGHTQEVKGISFGACGNLLASVARDGTLRLWDLDGSRPRERLVHKMEFGASWETVALSPDGTKLATGFDNRGFTLWEVSPSGLRVLAKHERGGNLLYFSPDSKMLFSSNGRDSHIIIDVSKPADIIDSLVLGRRSPLSFSIGAIAISPDCQTLAVGGDCELELWQRTASGWSQRLNSRMNCHIQSMSFSGNGNTLLVGGGTYKKPQVHLFVVTGDSPKRITTFTGLRDVALSVTASSTGKLFAAADATGRVIVWSASGKKLHEWKFPGPVHCVAFAPDGRHLALGNGDGTVYILRLTIPAGK